MSLNGPLTGITIVEMAAIGPVPHAGLVLAAMGADVLRIDRRADAGLGIAVDARFDALGRGKRAIALDLKNPRHLTEARETIARADALIEGFRPGVMERLGLGPSDCLAENPALVYGRVSGWGEAGPMADEAGHDLNFLGLTGVLDAIGDPAAPPPVPLNLIGDFGGAAMQLVAGVLAALLHARATGQGQIVATSIYEGAAALTPFLHGLRAAGRWTDARQSNLLDGGAPFYRCYATSDGRHVAVGAIEAKFYAALLAGLGLNLPAELQNDRATWPATAAEFAQIFATRTRDDWSARFAGTDACVTPVLDWTEAAHHPQATATAAYARAPSRMVLPRPAPRFSLTPGAVLGPAPGADRES